MEPLCSYGAGSADWLYYCLPHIHSEFVHKLNHILCRNESCFTSDLAQILLGVWVFGTCSIRTAVRGVCCW